MAKGGKGKALKPAKGKKAKHDANTAAQQVGAKGYVHLLFAAGMGGS